MNDDEWDSVSSGTPPDSANNAWDAVSAPQSSSCRRHVVFDDLVTDDLTVSQQEASVTPPSAPYQDISSTSPARQVSISASLLRKAAIFGVVLLLILAGSFGVFQGIRLFHNSNVPATATAEATATISTNAIATGQAVATATAAQQVYTQATSGTPAVDDPLSDDRNSWGVFTTDWGGQCAFTGGAYHLTLSKPNYTIVCTSGAVGVLRNSANFALQVQINIVRGDTGGFYFGDSATGTSSCGVFISSSGMYTLTQKKDGQSHFLQSGFNSAIKAGLNQVNVFTAIVNNSNLYLYANARFITHAYLNTYSQGGAGFLAENPNQSTDVAFSNLKIWV